MRGLDAGAIQDLCRQISKNLDWCWSILMDGGIRRGLDAGAIQDPGRLRVEQIEHGRRALQDLVHQVDEPRNPKSLSPPPTSGFPPKVEENTQNTRDNRE